MTSKSDTPNPNQAEGASTMRSVGAVGLLRSDKDGFHTAELFAGHPLPPNTVSKLYIHRADAFSALAHQDAVAWIVECEGVCLLYKCRIDAEYMAGYLICGARVRPLVYGDVIADLPAATLEEVDEAGLQEMLRRGAEAWKGVPDGAQWVREIRGTDEEDTDLPEGAQEGDDWVGAGEPPINTEKAGQDGFDAWWDAQVGANAGNSPGAEIRHWAKKAWTAATFPADGQAVDPVVDPDEYEGELEGAWSEVWQYSNDFDNDLMNALIDLRDCMSRRPRPGIFTPEANGNAVGDARAQLAIAISGWMRAGLTDVQAARAVDEARDTLERAVLATAVSTGVPPTWQNGPIAHEDADGDTLFSGQFDGYSITEMPNGVVITKDRRVVYLTNRAPVEGQHGPVGRVWEGRDQNGYPDRSVHWTGDPPEGGALLYTRPAAVGGREAAIQALRSAAKAIDREAWGKGTANISVEAVKRLTAAMSDSRLDAGVVSTVAERVGRGLIGNKAPAEQGGDRERALFERHHMGGSRVHARRNEHGDYVLPSIQDAWAGWRHRADMVVQSTAHSVDEAWLHEMDALLVNAHVGRTDDQIIARARQMVTEALSLHDKGDTA